MRVFFLNLATIIHSLSVLNSKDSSWYTDPGGTGGTYMYQVVTTTMSCFCTYTISIENRICQWVSYSGKDRKCWFFDNLRILDFWTFWTSCYVIFTVPVESANTFSVGHWPSIIDQVIFRHNSGPQNSTFEKRRRNHVQLQRAPVTDVVKVEWFWCRSCQF